MPLQVVARSPQPERCRSIGTTSTLPSRGVSASRYIGVPLAEGANRIELRAIPAGNSAELMESVVVTVRRAGRISELRLSVPESRSLPSLAADASSTTLLGAHYTTQVHARWTIGGSARRFAQQGTDTATYGVGFEVGWLALRNLWLTGGYNVIGFRDPWATSGDDSEAGPFFALRFKFDEGSLESLRDLRIDRAPVARKSALR